MVRHAFGDIQTPFGNGLGPHCPSIETRVILVIWVLSLCKESCLFYCFIITLLHPWGKSLSAGTTNVLMLVGGKYLEETHLSTEKTCKGPVRPGSQTAMSQRPLRPLIVPAPPNKTLPYGNDCFIKHMMLLLLWKACGCKAVAVVCFKVHAQVYLCNKKIC